MRRIATDLVTATQGRTSIIITHDPDVFITDSIVFLLDGTIADVGPHSELVERSSEYRELVTRNAEERTEQEKAKQDLEALTARVKDLEAVAGGAPPGPGMAPPGAAPGPRSGKVRIATDE